MHEEEYPNHDDHVLDRHDLQDLLEGGRIDITGEARWLLLDTDEDWRADVHRAILDANKRYHGP